MIFCTRASVFEAYNFTISTLLEKNKQTKKHLKLHVNLHGSNKQTHTKYVTFYEEYSNNIKALKKILFTHKIVEIKKYY